VSTASNKLIALQRWEDFLVGKITGGAKKDQGI
jgi:hypothetical protein